MPSHHEASPALVAILEIALLQTTRFEKLVGDLAGACSRRINIQHRLIHLVLTNEKVVKVLRM